MLLSLMFYIAFLQMLTMPMTAFMSPARSMAVSIRRNQLEEMTEKPKLGMKKSWLVNLFTTDPSLFRYLGYEVHKSRPNFKILDSNLIMYIWRNKRKNFFLKVLYLLLILKGEKIKCPQKFSL